jgi:hypothetical protein
VTEWLQVLIAFAALAVPVIGAAMARDRSLLTMIQTVKDDAAANVKASTDPIHERINRIRDEFVRRDDLEGHLERWDKQFEGLRDDLRRVSENSDRKLDEIRRLLQPGKMMG